MARKPMWDESKQPPQEQVRIGRCTEAEHRREIIVRAVRQIKLDGVRARPFRWDWAESRKRAGWDPALVDQAIGGGALGLVREKARIEVQTKNKALMRAIQALSIIDVGRHLEVTLPRRPERREAPAGG